MAIHQSANTQARRSFTHALALDPDYAAAAAFLGLAHCFEWLFWNPSPQVLAQAWEQAQRACSQDDALPEAHGISGVLYALSKQPEQALAEGERAIALNSNLADGYVWLGLILSYQDKPKEALGVLQQALRLNPHPPFPYFGSLGMACYLLRRYEGSIVAYFNATMAKPFKWTYQGKPLAA